MHEKSDDKNWTQQMVKLTSQTKLVDEQINFGQYTTKPGGSRNATGTKRLRAASLRTPAIMKTAGKMWEIIISAAS